MSQSLSIASYWLMRSWGRTICREASGLETQGVLAVCVQRQSKGRVPSSLRDPSLWSIKAFNLLGEAHPHPGQ